METCNSKFDTTPDKRIEYDAEYFNDDPNKTNDNQSLIEHIEYVDKVYPYVVNGPRHTEGYDAVDDQRASEEVSGAESMRKRTGWQLQRHVAPCERGQNGVLLFLAPLESGILDKQKVQIYSEEE